MAALSGPSLRSSSRRNASLEEVPPTDIQQNPLPNSHRGKRTRDNSLDNLSNSSVKKHKPSPPKPPNRSNEAVKSRALKALPLRDKPGTKIAVTSRPPDPPPQQINGSTTTTTLQDVQATSRINGLTINTTGTLSQAEKRSLRSHDGGSRSKSELALYFPNYDELVSIDPKEPGKHSSLSF